MQVINGTAPRMFQPCERLLARLDASTSAKKMPSVGARIARAHRLSPSRYESPGCFRPIDIPMLLLSLAAKTGINLQTAKALGLTIPPGVLVIADEVIE
jgi:hypothetical protein